MCRCVCASKDCTQKAQPSIVPVEVERILFRCFFLLFTSRELSGVFRSHTECGSKVICRRNTRSQIPMKSAVRHATHSLAFRPYFAAYVPRPSFQPEIVIQCVFALHSLALLAQKSASHSFLLRCYLSAPRIPHC